MFLFYAVQYTCFQKSSLIQQKATETQDTWNQLPCAFMNFINCSKSESDKMSLMQDRPNAGSNRSNSYLKGRDVICGPWSQLQHTSRGGDKWVRSNGELMINRGIGKKCGEKSSLGPLLHHESYMKSLGNERQGRQGTSRSKINEA